LDTKGVQEYIPIFNATLSQGLPSIGRYKHLKPASGLHAYSAEMSISPKAEILCKQPIAQIETFILWRFNLRPSASTEFKVIGHETTRQQQSEHRCLSQVFSECPLLLVHPHLYDIHSISPNGKKHHPLPSQTDSEKNSVRM